MRPETEARLKQTPITWRSFQYAEIIETIEYAHRTGDRDLLTKARRALAARNTDPRPGASGFKP